MSFYEITIVEPVTSYHQILDSLGTILFSFEWCGICRMPVYFCISQLKFLILGLVAFRNI